MGIWPINDYSYVKSCFWVLKRRMSCVMLGLACGRLWFFVADPRVFRSMKRLLGRTYAEAHEIGLRPSDLGADPAGYVGLPEDQVIVIDWPRLIPHISTSWNTFMIHVLCTALPQYRRSNWSGCCCREGRPFRWRRLLQSSLRLLQCCRYWDCVGTLSTLQRLWCKLLRDT